MKTIEIKAEAREVAGKRIIKDLRKESIVPGVIYDNSQVTHIKINSMDLRPAIYTEDTYIVKINLDGNILDTIIRDIQFHPVTEKILHIDLLRVTDEKPVSLSLPLTLTGTPVGVAKGGKLAVKLRRVKVKGIPAKMPEKVEIDVSDIDLGGTIKVSEANVEGIELLTSPSAAVASVIIPRSLRSAKSKEETE